MSMKQMVREWGSIFLFAVALAIVFIFHESVERFAVRNPATTGLLAIAALELLVIIVLYNPIKKIIDLIF